MEKDNKNVKCLRYIYILKVDNMGRKSKYWGHEKIFYTGQAVSIRQRMREHLYCMNSDFLTKNFRDARKILVFVDYFLGDENDTKVEEFKIKSMAKYQKLKLINSDRNKLIAYKPCKAIVLKKYQHEDEQECIKLNC